MRSSDRSTGVPDARPDGQPADADCWAPVTPGFGLANLPYGVVASRGRSRVVARVGDSVLPLAEVVGERHRDVVEAPDLNRLVAAGPGTWREVRERLVAHLVDRRNERELTPVDAVPLRLPFTPRDYVDFSSSLDHATRVGRLFRPDGDPLPPAWKHVPVGYHGRSGTVAVSGTPVRRPAGRARVGWEVRRQPTAQLDFELEVGFVVGALGGEHPPVDADDAGRHLFGAVLVNDWSARDVQAFESQPLGPFLGKSFLTSVSPWVVPLAALEPFRRPGPAQDPPPDLLLRTAEPWALDVELAVELCGTTVCRTNLSRLYWSGAQQLAHLVSNGTATTPGDLIATGTVSGSGALERGCLLELTGGGHDPVVLDDGTTRAWLADGDTVRLTGWAGSDGGPTVSFGECTGTVLADRSLAPAPVDGVRDDVEVAAS